MTKHIRVLMLLVLALMALPSFAQEALAPQTWRSRLTPKAASYVASVDAVYAAADPARPNIEAQAAFLAERIAANTYIGITMNAPAGTPMSRKQIFDLCAASPASCPGAFIPNYLFSVPELYQFGRPTDWAQLPEFDRDALTATLGIGTGAGSSPFEPFDLLDRLLAMRKAGYGDPLMSLFEQFADAKGAPSGN